jgi:hypothetical protein
LEEKRGVLPSRGDAGEQALMEKKAARSVVHVLFCHTSARAPTASPP